MDATHYILFFCLMCHYCYLHEACEDPEECRKVLSNEQVKPINLSVDIRETYLHLSWDCDFPPEIQNKTEYEIYSNYPKQDEQYKYEVGTKKCNTSIPLGTHSTVCLKVTPTIDDEAFQQLSSEKCVNLERNGTLAENVSCRVYNTSSMTCTWMFGKNAPDSTSYKLSLRQGTTTDVLCQQYEIHFQTRTGACTFHDLRLHFFDDVTVVLKGSDPGIEVFEEKIRLAHIEMINPPRNISMTSFEDSLTIFWQSPQRQYSVGDNCFTYNIQKNKDQYYPKINSNQYTIPNMEKECLVRIRASGIKECGMNTHWGEWSEWISCGPLPVFAKPEWQFELTPVILVSGLILVLLIITTLQCKRIVKTCFPRIPQPKNYLETTEDSKINIENNGYFSLKLQTSETEECIIIIKENFS